MGVESTRNVRDPHLEKVWPRCPGMFGCAHADSQSERESWPIWGERRIEATLFFSSFIDFPFASETTQRVSLLVPGAHASNSIRHSWAFMERPRGLLANGRFPSRRSVPSACPPPVSSYVVVDDSAKERGYFSDSLIAFYIRHLSMSIPSPSRLLLFPYFPFEIILLTL